jgi:predicted Rossmann fold flavoprotein
MVFCYDDQMDENTIWDVVVVGGGPSGMMSAGVSAERRAKVVLLEKNETLGKKLLITGGGRCNVTNSEFDNRKLLEKFKDKSKFLFSAFSQWSVKETLDFFHIRGMETKVENELRTFPVSNTAQSVWDVLVENLKKNKVTVFSNSKVVEIVKENEKVIGVRLQNEKIIKGKNIVIATGGMSRPETGSTGDGFLWLKNIGHTIIPSTSSLVPVVVKDEWSKKISGLTLPKVKITLFQNRAKQEVSKGKVLFTHFGLSGPTILNMSKDIGELLKYGEVFISLDLLPDLDHGVLNSKLQETFKENHKKKLKNSLSDLIPSAIVSRVLEVSGVSEDIECNSITRENRLKLVDALKGLMLEADSLLGEDKAIVTSGGVTLDVVDFKTMRSRLFPNLYLVGDILNIDRPSGGYSLQLCWTTGFVAGNSCEF